MNLEHRSSPDPDKEKFDSIISRAGQAFLDQPERTRHLYIGLFGDLVASATHTVHSEMTYEKIIKRFHHIRSVDTKVKIARGLHQATRSALSHILFIEIGKNALRALEKNEPLSKIQEDGKTYKGIDYINKEYPGEYHNFMLAGLRMIQEPANESVAALRNTEDPYHELLVVTYESQALMNQAQEERKKGISSTSVIYHPGSLESYKPEFMGNVRDIMTFIVAVQKAYITRLQKDGISELPNPEAIAQLVLRNLDTFFLPAHISREAGYLKYNTPVTLFPDPEEIPPKPFADLQEMFIVAGDVNNPILEYPGGAELAKQGRSYCSGIFPYQSPKKEDRETAERLLSVAGIPSGREPGHPSYGTIDPMTPLAIIGTRIAVDTFLKVNPC